MLYIFHGYPTICAMVLTDGWSEEWKIDLACHMATKPSEGQGPDR